jgi:CheY-like chemotaxis protein
MTIRAAGFALSRIQLSPSFSGTRSHIGIYPYNIKCIAQSAPFISLDTGGAVPTNILLVDDSSAVRPALRAVIETQTNWQVAGEAENGLEAIEKFRELSPDVVILDLSMPRMNGLDAARHIRAISPSVRILLFTLHAYPYLVEDARKIGINQVVLKDNAALLLGAVRSALA